jgi:hypothetical protein
MNLSQCDDKKPGLRPGNFSSRKITHIDRCRLTPSPLYFFKSALRYIRTPISRLKQRNRPLIVLFGRKLSADTAELYFPDCQFKSSNGIPKKLHFYSTWAPWLLGNRHSKLYYLKELPGFMLRFCQRWGIETESLLSARPDIPASVLFAPQRAHSKKKGKTQSFAPRAIPDWYRAHPTSDTKAALAQNSPIYFYTPWIAEHGDTLIGRIASPDYQCVAFDMIKDIESNATRREVLEFARTSPDLYRRMVIRRLVPLQSRISGFILTFDWTPVMRIIASVCRELGIPTILIPHESVFVDRSKYYWDIRSGASVPVSDVILGWGGLQREIFAERGYPDDRFIAVGAPKFDVYHHYVPKLTRERFYGLYGLKADRKTILFASQPLDSQLDAREARTSQRLAISDLLDFAETRGAQLIVRLPPSKDDVLGSDLRARLLNSEFGAYDDATCYMATPEEALYHCDVVTSVNSTMLFEGMLIGRPALSMKYVEFDQIWEQAGVPAARTAAEAEPYLDAMLRGDWRLEPAGMAWAAQSFGVGDFDGKASDRIRAYLTDLASGAIQIKSRPSIQERLQARLPLDVVAIASSDKIMSTTQLYLPTLVNARTIFSSSAGKLEQLASVDLFLQWGIMPSAPKEAQRVNARLLGKPVVIVEDGFIRSIDIGLSGTPGLSIILDEITAYYDATRPSQLELTFQNGRDLSATEKARARAAIDKIVRHKVTKYNHAPRRPVEVGRRGVPKVLVIDQRAGDQSITSGLGSTESFMRMLEDAIGRHPDCDVIIKRHPDAMSGGKIGYFDNEMTYVPEEHRHRVFLFDEEINPYSLLDIVGDVYVVTSGLGFEALMAGKRVHCYGAPFYSGWGCTRDHVTLERRSRRRSVEELFHFAYIEASRYVDPDVNRLVEVEDIVDWIVENRDKQDDAPAYEHDLAIAV